ncbi:MAG: HlyD family efflux transporter periplasmic adaptor subunit, partial [Gammaproteobacteria bacterium]
MTLIKLAVCGFLLFFLTVAAHRVLAAAPGTVTVALRSFTREYRAYAQVEPRRVVTIRAAATGVIAALKVLPGERVRAGEELVELAGPDYLAELAAARARRDAARSNLATVRGNFPQFSSAQNVADARAALVEAESALRRLRVAAQVRAPADAIVLAVDAADGERVGAGQSLVSLQPSRQLWLRAAYY